jgi:lysophospholipase L1-like esterase
MRRHRRFLPLLVAILLLALPALANAAIPCTGTHWIGAWADAPSDAPAGSTIADIFDPSGHLKTPVNNETIRAVLMPTYGGSTIRIHLSNRFGVSPAVFGHVTIALKGDGAALAGPATTITFNGGSQTLTLAPGQDAVSDPVHFSFNALQLLAVSMFVSNDAGKPTEHYTGRQTSYLTAAGAGDHTTDTAATAFTNPTTDRDYVDGIDVLAPGSAGAIVTFGDSITDGYQGMTPLGVPEVTGTLDTNGRWPDDLARRLIAAHIPLSVLNEGISGNRVLQDGAVGGNYDTFGPSALSRLQADVLRQSGVTTVIWLEGINDLGQTPNASAAQLEAGWTKGIAQMHAAGLKVLQGTLTPSGGANGTYATAATNQVRQQLNTWIRTKSPADGVIDFDAAVRNSTDTAINPAYDGGDHLHFNLAGYQAMANAINLSQLRPASCTLPRLHVTITPRTLPAATRTVLRVRVTTPVNGRQVPVRGAIVTIGATHARTDRSGRAKLRVHTGRSGHMTVNVTATGEAPARITVPIRRAS